MFTLQIQKINEAFRATIRQNDAILSMYEFADGEAAQDWGLAQLEELTKEQSDRIAELTVRFCSKQ